MDTNRWYYKKLRENSHWTPNEWVYLLDFGFSKSKLVILLFIILFLLWLKWPLNKYTDRIRRMWRSSPCNLLLPYNFHDIYCTTDNIRYYTFCSIQQFVLEIGKPTGFNFASFNDSEGHHNMPARCSNSPIYHVNNHKLKLSGHCANCYN